MANRCQEENVRFFRCLGVDPTKQRGQESKMSLWVWCACQQAIPRSWVSRTVNLPGHLHAHLDQLELIYLGFEIAHEALEDFDSVRWRFGMVEELEQFDCKLMP